MRVRGGARLASLRQLGQQTLGSRSLVGYAQYVKDSLRAAHFPTVLVDLDRAPKLVAAVAEGTRLAGPLLE